MRIAFVSAEFDPLVKVGGLGEAAAGLVEAIRATGTVVHVILPDYGGVELEHEVRETLTVPAWAGPAVARHGVAMGAGPVTLLSVPGMAREHPYHDPSTGHGWADNDHRFLAFGAAVAELVTLDPPDTLHLNDWHTAGVTAFADPAIPTVLTLHNIAHQGWTDHRWLQRLGPRAAAFLHGGEVNLLAGGIRLADQVVAVSGSYAQEITRPGTDHGLADVLSEKGQALTGIRNGIAREHWNPARDSHLAAPFTAADLSGKRTCRNHLLQSTGRERSAGPVIGMVARLDHQKGIDIALSLAPILKSLPARLILHGSGDPSLADFARRTATDHPGSLTVLDGYRDDTAHRIVAGSDLILVPSRFEPCGLTQMQAMSYGTIPVVTEVGGLKDTVIDLDLDHRRGTGFVAERPDAGSVADALRRAVRAWRSPRRRLRAQHRGMTADWSWTIPAAHYLNLYKAQISRRMNPPKGSSCH